MCQNQIQIPLFWISTDASPFPVRKEQVCTGRRVNRNYEKADAAWNTKLQNAKFSAFGSKGVVSAFSLFQILPLLDTKNQKIIQEIIIDV